MQLKLDQDGFIDEALVDDVRAGLSTAGTALGPINKRTLKRNRQQFRDLTASFAKQTEWVNAQQMSAAILDDVYLVTNKPTIAWDVEDVLLGLTFTIGSHDQFQALDDETIIAFTADLLQFLALNGMAQVDLAPSLAEQWVIDELAAYRDNLANETLTDETSQTTDSIKPLLTKLASQPQFETLDGTIQESMVTTMLPLFADMMREIAHEPLGKWTTTGLKRILFNYFVPTVVLTVEQQQHLPDVIAMFVDANPAVAVDAPTFMTTAQQLAWQFEHEASYPGYYSADKRVATVATESGISLNDQQALDEFADDYWASKAGQEKFGAIGRGFGGLWDYLENERLFQDIKLKSQDARLFYQYMEPFYIQSLDPDWEADYDFERWQKTIAHNTQLAVLDTLYGRTKVQMIKHIAMAFGHQSSDEVQHQVQIWLQQINDLLGPVLQLNDRNQVVFDDKERLLRAVQEELHPTELAKLPVLMAATPAELRESNHNQVDIFIEKLQIQLGDVLEADQVRLAEEILDNLTETAGGQWQMSLQKLSDEEFTKLLSSELFGVLTMRQAYFGLQIIIAFLDNSRALAELTKPRFDEFVRLIKTTQDQQVSQYLLDIAERMTLETPI